MTLRHDFMLSAAVMMMAAPTFAQGGVAKTEKPVFTIVAFGDSITLAHEQPENLRWPFLLEQQLNTEFPERVFRVINAGVGGNTSREGLKRMAADVLAHKPDLVLVEFGGNDATSEPDRHVSHVEFRANLESIRKEINKLPGAKMAVVTFPPLVDAWHGWSKEAVFKAQGGVEATIETYRKVARDFAQANGLVVANIDKALSAAIRESSAEKYILNDGVHLRAQGNQVVADEVFRAIRGIL